MHRSPSQGGFSMIELMVVMGMMLTATVLVMSFMNDSIRISNTTKELTEAQQNLRTAQDFINRDLMIAGDGMESIKSPRLPQTFISSYLSRGPVPDAGNPALGVLGVLTSDDQVPAGTAVPGATPAVTVLPNSDRLTILQLDTTFNNGLPIPLVAGSVTGLGANVTLPVGTNMAQFMVGDIYFFNSSRGSAFGCVTGVNAGSRLLTFGTAGDPYGINQPVANGPINNVVNGGAQVSTMMRMLAIHYFIDANGLLRRRTFGVRGGVGYSDMVVAEHVSDLQLRYIVGASDANGNVIQPTKRLNTETLQGSVRQVEVTLTTETAHPVVKGNKQPISTTTATSIRNLQFNTSLKPD